MMNTAKIYNSIMYKTSSRQNEILAAIQNPMNKELVDQLDAYLDDDVKSKSKKITFKDKRTSESDLDSKSSGDSKRLPGSNPTKFSDDANDSNDKLNSLDSDTDSDTEDVDLKTNSKDASVDSSTIVSSACSGKLDHSVLSEIKDNLNGVADTSGVNRIRIKDSEIWIYYEDRINLNSVMSCVLEYLNSWGYNYLEFNRLARSDNAMVFELICDSSETSMNPMTEV